LGELLLGNDIAQLNWQTGAFYLAPMKKLCPSYHHEGLPTWSPTYRYWYIECLSPNDKYVWLFDSSDKQAKFGRKMRRNGHPLLYRNRTNFRFAPKDFHFSPQDAYLFYLNQVPIHSDSYWELAHVSTGERLKYSSFLDSGRAEINVLWYQDETRFLLRQEKKAFRIRYSIESEDQPE
jgi:hypothetical protein